MTRHQTQIHKSFQTTIIAYPYTISFNFPVLPRGLSKKTFKRPFTFMIDALWTHVLLVQQTESQAFLIDSLPNTWTDKDNEEALVFLAIPHDLKPGRSIIYSFNVGDKYCSCWAFQNRDDDVKSAVVVVSSVFRPFLFEEVLHRASTCARASGVNDARSRHVFVYSALNSIEYVNDIHFVVRLPCENIRVKATEDPWFWLRCRNCAVLGDNIEPVWQTVMTNGRVLIVGKDTKVVSRAGIEALSLFSGIRFLENYATFSQMDDPREKFLSKCHILATTDFTVDRSEFDLVIRVTKPNNKNHSRVTDDFWNRTGACYRLMAGLWRTGIQYDPYLDICKKRIEADWRNPEVRPLSGPEFLEKAQSTRTFTRLRKSLLEPEMLRLSFLSVAPKDAVNTLENEQLEDAHKKVTMLMNLDILQNDAHLLVVFKQHLQLIKQRMDAMSDNYRGNTREL